MSVAILPNSAALAVGVPQPFSPVGGTGPYTFSVLSGGGSVNAGTGIFKAGLTPGVSVVRVTDSMAATADATILVATPMGLLVDIIQQEMGLAQDRVYLWDQKINAPTDAGIFVAISQLSCKPFSNGRAYDGSGAGLDVIQSSNFQALCTLDIISRSIAARDRKEEMILALNSVYSEQQQELNSFRIFPLSQSFVNLSELEGAAIPYRFSISINMQYAVVKTKSVPYYDSFSAATVATDP